MNSLVATSRDAGYHPVEVTLGRGSNTGAALGSAVVVSSPPTIAVAVTSGVPVPGVQVVPIASGLSIVRCSSIGVRSDPNAATSLAVERMEAAHRPAVGVVVGGKAVVDYGLGNSCFRRPYRRRYWIWSSS
jgi:hypothetical protein